ncbi:hypothetical protein KVF89_01855 [Nocardioides carbamazepini]|uniref:P-loop NTPase fold protein n=1 Tax=Nocardioides carbamazepini TaxID=2854259 RepID=UPI002149E53B|nr:P-loop NTPase fold protein [Nocardioides carbamazepini]MCR1781265.1 hypothetical protein [Nocardioides carbamazepini]
MTSSSAGSPNEEVPDLIVDARHEAARIREEAREQGAAIVSEMRESAQGEAVRIIEHSKRLIERDRRNSLREMLQPTSRAVSSSYAPPVHTRLTSDGGPRVDLLDVSDDARALGSLLASRSLTPPFVLGIYGEWGSGKSFFMRQVEANIRDLTKSKVPGSPFCRNVAHVWFNAWHYEDGNLWASLIDQIFDVLSERPSRYQALVREAIENLTSAEEVTAVAEARVQAASDRVRQANDALDIAQRRRDDAVTEARRVRATDLWQTITVAAADDGLADQVRSAAGELGLNSVAETATELRAATESIRDTADRARALATVGGLRSPIAIAIYAWVVVATVAVLVAFLVEDWGQASASIALYFGQVVAIGSSAAAWLKRQQQTARRLLAPAERLQARLDRQVEAAQVEHAAALAAAEDELRASQAELQDARATAAAAEIGAENARRERHDLTGSRLLHTYLQDRAESTDYQNYLGVVALAHRDLRDLVEFMNAVDSDDNDRLERIILYIDDLDRCESQTVADVLAAIHLLLALPLFTVVVGVSPQRLERSLSETREHLLGAVDGENANTYLEKIFQLTFTLRPMTAATTRNLLFGLAFESIHGADELSTTPDLHARHRGPEQDDALDDMGTSGGPNPDGSRRYRTRLGDNPSPSPTTLASALNLDEREFGLIQTVAPLLSTTPRRSQRFLNLYLALRARYPDSDQAYDQLLTTTAIALGVPNALQATLDTPPRQHSTAARELLEHSTGVEIERLNQTMFDNSNEIALSRTELDLWIDRIWPYLPRGYQPVFMADEDGGRGPAGP